MIRIDQTDFYDATTGARGNCLTACLASILHLPLVLVPKFADMPQSAWMDYMRMWLASIGRDWEYESTHDDAPRGMHYIANGRSPRGVRHSVVCLDGAIVHDPHPSRAGIETVDGVWWFPALDEKRRAALAPHLAELQAEYLPTECPSQNCGQGEKP